MKSGEKLITIVVPAYNVQNYVDQCLNSLLNQTINNHKVIIVDDGSKDEHTSEICKSYSEHYPDMFTYIHQENKGLGAARNTGLKHVDTQYVGFLDSDDWLMPNYIEKITEQLEIFKSEDIDLIFTLPVIYDSLTHMNVDWYDKQLFLEIFYGDQRLVSPERDKRLYQLEPNACRRIYNLDFLKRNHFSFPEGVKWEDIYPHFKLLYRANVCLGIKDVGFHYRINTAGQITAQTGKSRLDMVKVFRDTFQFATTENVEWDFMSAVIEMLVKYTKWSLSVADINTRPLFVEQISKLYREIPRRHLKKYCHEHRRLKKDCVFIWILLHKNIIWVLNDYVRLELISATNKKIRRVFYHG